jgi:hypothetical protein
LVKDYAKSLELYEKHKEVIDKTDFTNYDSQVLREGNFTNEIEEAKHLYYKNQYDLVSSTTD